MNHSKCDVCGTGNLGTVYEFNNGRMCIQCEGELRNHLNVIGRIPEVPTHIPLEQHKRYVMRILERDLGIEIKYR
jgi:hypothetical protein